MKVAQDSTRGRDLAIAPIFRNETRIRWAHTKTGQPYVILQNTVTRLRVSIMYFTRTDLYVVRFPFAGPRGIKQSRNEFKDLLTAFAYARNVIA